MAVLTAQEKGGWKINSDGSRWSRRKSNQHQTRESSKRSDNMSKLLHRSLIRSHICHSAYPDNFGARYADLRWRKCLQLPSRSHEWSSGIEVRVEVRWKRRWRQRLLDWPYLAPRVRRHVLWPYGVSTFLLGWRSTDLVWTCRGPASTQSKDLCLRLRHQSLKRLTRYWRNFEIRVQLANACKR